MLFVDQMIMDDKPRLTADGYLVATPRIARTGLQDYGGAELGRPDLDIVKVYRPESEVFAKDSLHSMGHRPVTIDHPPELVDASNWKKYSRGQTGGDVARDGEFIRVPMSLMDLDAVRNVEAGKVELSMGYTADLLWESGTTPEGEHYDAIQTNIRGNHLAVVDAARGGSKLRVIDTNAKPKEQSMNLKKVVIDGITVETTDTAAEVYEKHIKALDAESKTRDEKIKELEDELENLRKEDKEQKDSLATKDAEIATLKQQVSDSEMTPAKLDDAVKARAAVVDAARKVVSDVVVDGKSDSEIRKQVVSAKLGDAAKDWSDDQISASFNTLTATSTTDSYARVVADGGNGGQKVNAYDAYKARIEQAHKPKKEA